MELCIFLVTLVMSELLRKQEEVEMDEETDQLELQMKKNFEMFHLNVGSAPNTVLSALSGSPSCHTLTFLVIFLLVQTCGGEMTSFNLSLLKSNTTPSADPPGSLICFTPAAFYPILVFALVVIVAFCILFACYIQRCKGSKSDMEGGLLGHPSSSTLEDGTGDLVIKFSKPRRREASVVNALKEPKKLLENQKDQLKSQLDVMMKQMKEKDDKMLDLVKKLSKCEEILQREASVVNALKEQKKLLENQKDQLKSQLEEVERKKTENKEKLLSVENKITAAEKGKKDKGGLLKEKESLTDVKWKLDEQKKALEKLKLNVEQLLQIIDASAGGDRVQ